MAITLKTITGKIVIPGTTIGIRATVTATPMTNAQALTFPLDDVVSWGPVVATTDANGVLPASFKIPTNSDQQPELLWKFTAVPVDKHSDVPKSWLMGHYPITGTGTIDLADLVDVDVNAFDQGTFVTLQSLVSSASASATAAAASATSAAASASVAATLVTTDLGTTDGQSFALVTDPNSLTGRALTDGYADARAGGQDRRFGDPQHEDETTYAYPTRIDFGDVSPAPSAIVPGHKGVDLIAHWYNDFGLDHTADGAAEANGWYGWYDWRWNFPSNTGDGIATVGYDEARHPLQGFYQGDNADVLNWQCYWLASAGITAVNLDPGVGFSSTGWATPGSSKHWLYQLFTNTPNFRSLNYILGLKYDGTTSAIEAQNDDVVDTYDTYPGGHTYTEDGKTYAVVWIWDLEYLRGVYDAYVGNTLTVAWLKGLAAKFQAIGYDGVCVLARNLGGAADDTLKANGVLLLEAAYEGRYGDDTTDYANSYADYATTAPFTTTADAVVNVVTAAESAYPHPSGWNLPGSTPTLFRQALSRAIDSVVKNGQRRMVTIYNVSEWAEGGPGLLPQVRDGFGYLDAIRSTPVAPPLQTSGPDTPQQFAAYNSYGTGVPTSTWTDARFTVESTDSAGFHGGDVAQVTIPTNLGGTYLVVATGAMTYNATGLRVVELRKAGVAIATAGWAGADANQGQCMYLGPLADGDVLTVALWQDSGGSVAQSTGTRISLVRLGD